MEKIHPRWQTFTCRKNVCQVMGDDHDDIAKLGKILRDSSVLFTDISAGVWCRNDFVNTCLVGGFLPK